MAGTTSLKAWEAAFEILCSRIAPLFGRKDLGRRAEAYLRGLTARVERKNSWQLAETVGDTTPHGFQRLLGRAQWDADALRDDLRDYVIEHLGDRRGVLIIDETGFLKKGTKSVGVGRQYSGTAGRIENCQVGVFMAYRSRHGSAFLDRALYLPKAWTDDRTRLRAADVPDDVAFATKPELAREMVRRAMRSGVPARWVTADEVYGSDSKFRRCLESEGLDYVVAVSSGQRVWIGLKQVRADRIAADLPPSAWKRLSCGTGTKGQRVYDWAFVRFPFQSTDQAHKGLLIRRSITDPSDHAYYLCKFSRRATVAELVETAGSRWSIETGFEQAKQETGLDDYEVRSWIGWHRHITLSLVAHAFLEVLRKRASQSSVRKKEESAS